jgi:NDP-sugar pyrophosphorylase family protein
MPIDGEKYPMRAVILAGGKGTRLRPYTTVFPKPLMPIGDEPILKVVVSQLKNAGFTHVTMAVGYMADMIRTYFNEGAKFGLKIDYSHERKPLGTIGALSLIDNFPENFIVMNGDILTDLNFRDFFEFHKKHAAKATIATFCKKVKIEYGIIEANGDQEVNGYVEKPTMEYEVSMGVYAFHASIVDYIEKERYLDFPDLVKRLLAKKEKIVKYPFDGYWMDIGCHADYEKASKDFPGMKQKLIGGAKTA